MAPTSALTVMLARADVFVIATTLYGEILTREDSGRPSPGRLPPFW
jgi:hypothetical protein